MRLFPIRLRRSKGAPNGRAAPANANDQDLGPEGGEEEVVEGGEGWLSTHGVKKSYRGQLDFCR